MQILETPVPAFDGVQLYVRKLGDGPNPVLIPNAAHMRSFERLAEDRTVILFDLRNRGASETIADPDKLARGIHHDVDDIEAIRRHFGLDRVNLIGHSYLGLVVILYALKYPEHVGRVVQIGASQPNAATQYPPNQSNFDAVHASFVQSMGEMFRQTPSCARFWTLLQRLMVVDARDIDKVDWSPCGYPNEAQFLQHWLQNLMPSIHALQLDPADLRAIQAPVLTIHGTLDRQSPYGAALEWVDLLGNARLLKIADAAHVPWIEAPEIVFPAIKTFLDATA
jgi:proline iminopeptidase